MKKLLMAFLSFAAFPMFAQQPVQIVPTIGITTNSSGTILVTNTFQNIFNSSQTNIQQSFTSPGIRSRSSCFIQNNGTHTMYVFFGPLANASQANSINIPAGSSISCTYGPITVQDQISISGTSSDNFTALVW